MYGNLDKSDSYFAVPCSSICIDREISHIFLRSKSSLHYWSTGVRMPEPGESLLSSKYTGDCLARVIRVITSHYPPDPLISNSGPETICVVTLCLLSLSGISDANIASTQSRDTCPVVTSLPSPVHTGQVWGCDLDKSLQ